MKRIEEMKEILEKTEVDGRIKAIITRMIEETEVLIKSENESVFSVIESNIILIAYYLNK